MKQAGINACIFSFAIITSLFLGKLVAHLLGGLPGSLYGMLIFFGLLQTGIIEAEKVQFFATYFIQYMPIVFLPVCIGVIEYGDVIQTFGIKLLIIGMVATFTTLTLVAIIANKTMGDPPDNNLPINNLPINNSSINNAAIDNSSTRNQTQKPSDHA